jgi:anti-sigma factor RsiW
VSETRPPGTSVDPDNVREEDLHAFVDGRLAPSAAAAVAAWLSARPEAAARVAAWQSQRAGLQSLHVGLLNESAPLAMTSDLRRPRHQWFAGLAASLLAGVALGWALHANTSGASREAGLFAHSAPVFVRDAAAAHAVYVPERRHPVEVGASEQEHLLQWLSKRLGAPLRAPDFRTEGYELVGGRLLPGRSGEARAQFMYQSGAGERLTLYISVFPEGAAPAPASFSYAHEGDLQSFYWIDGRQGCALTGTVPREKLAALARKAYEQTAS